VIDKAASSFPNDGPVRVSVVIPVRNEELVIGPCLYSLLNQEAMPDEIIVVDNASDDRTVEVVGRFDSVHILRETRKGIVFARNTGFDDATGEIIARCDADSRLPRDWIARITDTLVDPGVLAVTGPADFYDLPIWIRSVASAGFRWIYFNGSRWMLRHETLYGSNMALTKEAWYRVRDEVCTDERVIHEDIDLAIHLSQHGMIIFDPTLTVFASSRAAREPVSMLRDRIRRWRTTKTSHRYLSQLCYLNNPSRKYLPGWLQRVTAFSLVSRKAPTTGQFETLWKGKCGRF
jgi:glycosyltransferase involved in cell wall biosynthesis